MILDQENDIFGFRHRLDPNIFYFSFIRVVFSNRNGSFRFKMKFLLQIFFAKKTSSRKIVFLDSFDGDLSFFLSKGFLVYRSKKIKKEWTETNIVVKCSLKILQDSKNFWIETLACIGLLELRLRKYFTHFMSFTVILRAVNSSTAKVPGHKTICLQALI